MSLECYQNPLGASSENLPSYSNELSGNLQILIDHVHKMCDQELTDYSHIVHSARCNRYFDVLYHLFCEKKQQMGLPVDNRLSRFDQHAQVQKIDNKLKECMGYADLSWDECDEEDRETEQLDDRYHEQLAEVRTDFAQFSQLLQAKSIDLSAELMRKLNEQKLFRPITASDMERCRGEIELKFLDYQNQLKQLTYQNFMLLRSKHFDARRKRKNFSKDATRILTEFFYSHIDHPYPSEDAKVELARRCNITINQVSNWFGNKRIRTKKSQGRHLEGNSGDTGSNFEEASLQCPSDKLRQQQQCSVVASLGSIPLDYQPSASEAQQYFDYPNYDHTNVLHGGDALEPFYSHFAYPKPSETTPCTSSSALVPSTYLSL